MRHIAIIGSGPAGYYTAEAAQKAFGEDVRIDIFDTLPVPFGLIRSGVAPDHQSIKGVSRRYEKVALSDTVRFVGNVCVGRDISIAELGELYDAVVLATGAPKDRDLGIPGEDLGNVFGSAAFVGWYNGHPEFAGSDIVAHALEVLDASRVERIVILGRRGPHQIMMTPKELGELGELERAAPHVAAADLPAPEEDAILEPGLRKSVSHLRAFAATPEHIRAEKPKAIEFVFMSSPKALIGNDKVEAIEVERTSLVHGRAEGTGETYRLPADLVVSCIGYRTSPIPGVPFDERAGRFANDEGRILPGLYCVGWARRGPSGTIGTNRPDGYSVVDKIAEDIGSGVLGRGGKAGREGFDWLAAERALDVVTFRDWKKIEEAEERAAREGAPREKFVDIEAMIRARR